MKFTGPAAGMIVFLLGMGTLVHAEDQTRIPYLEARQISHMPSLQRADIQRELVFLSAQTRLTPSWSRPYRDIADVALRVGRDDLAYRALLKYQSLRHNIIMAQLELINLELQGLFNVENRRQYLENKLNERELLPEVISDIYRQLAYISWQNFETERAKKYLNLAIRRVPQNMAAYELLRQIVEADKNVSPIEELEVRTEEIQGKLMTNPYDAQSAIEMAIVCGKAGESEPMKFWLDEVERLVGKGKGWSIWPRDLRLELAESFLAIGKPNQAVEVLKGILQPATVSTSTPSTKPTETENNVLRSHLLLSLATKAMNDNTTAKAQETYLRQYADNAIAQKKGETSSLILCAIYWTLYSDHPDYLRAISLARIAREAEPGNSMTAMALALPMAISGEVNQSSKLLDESHEPNHPLVLLAKAFIESNKKNQARAKELLALCVKNTPYGPLRDVVIATAGRLNLPVSAEPDLSAIREKIRKFDARYPAITTGEKTIGDLTLSIRGKLTRGQIVDLHIEFTNKTPIPLALGPGSLIEPYFVLEFRPASNRGNTKSFVHYVTIDARQILETGKSIDADEVLNQIDGWDEFVIRRDQSIAQVTVNAKLVTTLPLKNQSMIVLAESPAAMLDLPKLDAKNADELIRRLSGPIGNDPWDTAQLAKWILMKADLADRKSALIDGMLRQLSADCSDSTQAAFIWALQSAGNDPKVINAVAERLKSKSWLVRLMAIDTLGKLQGKAAKKIFEFYAANDCDDLVRKLCAGYLLKQ
jgi:hypothetical protein